MRGQISYEWKPIENFDNDDMPEFMLGIAAVAMDGKESWFFESEESLREAIEDLCLEQYAFIAWPKLPGEADASPADAS